MDIMTALAALSHAPDGVKKLRDIEKDFDAATYKPRSPNWRHLSPTRSWRLLMSKMRLRPKIRRSGDFSMLSNFGAMGRGSRTERKEWFDVLKVELSRERYDHCQDSYV